MEFVISFDDGTQTSFTGDARFAVTDEGVLRVTDPASETEIHYSPSGWRSVTKTGDEGTPVFIST